MKVVPAEFRQNAHHWLILHGRYTCLARSPRCPECAIRDLCAFKHKTKPPEPKRPKTPPAARRKPKPAPAKRKVA
jgi:endonuclease-3